MNLSFCYCYKILETVHLTREKVYFDCFSDLWLAGPKAFGLVASQHIVAKGKADKATRLMVDRKRKKRKEHPGSQALLQESIPHNQKLPSRQRPSTAPGKSHTYTGCWGQLFHWEQWGFCFCFLFQRLFPPGDLACPPPWLSLNSMAMGLTNLSNRSPSTETVARAFNV